MKNCGILFKGLIDFTSTLCRKNSEPAILDYYTDPIEKACVKSAFLKVLNR